MDNLVLINKKIEDKNVKIIFNDSNVLLKGYLGLYLNEELTLLPSIDLYEALRIIDIAESINELKEKLLANSWIKNLNGAN